VDKSLIWEITAIMEHHGFKYIEHFAFVYLSAKHILGYRAKFNYNRIHVLNRLLRDKRLEEVEAKHRKAKQKITNFFQVQQTPKSEQPFDETIPKSPEKLNEFIMEHIESLKDVDARSLFANQKHKYIRSSKKIMLLFRKVSSCFRGDLARIAKAGALS